MESLFTHFGFFQVFLLPFTADHVTALHHPEVRSCTISVNYTQNRSTLSDATGMEKLNDRASNTNNLRGTSLFYFLLPGQEFQS